MNVEKVSHKGWSTHGIYSNNMKKLYDILCSNFHVSWTYRKEDGKDHLLDIFYGLLIKAWKNCLRGHMKGKFDEG